LLLRSLFVFSSPSYSSASHTSPSLVTPAAATASGVASLRWRFLVLDSFDLGIIGRDKSHPSFVRAAEILNAQNPNNVVNGDGSGWFTGLTGTKGCPCWYERVPGHVYW
jgi:hypothetical protein